MDRGRHWQRLNDQIERLPTLPGVAIRILQAMRRDAPRLGELADIISADAPLSARLLKTVNSPFYGLSTKIASIHQAMIYLGLNAVKNLAMSFSLLDGFARRRSGLFDYAQFSKDSLIGALSAKALTEKINPQLGKEAFILGLLQNIGMPVMAEALPVEYGKAIAAAGGRGLATHAAEHGVLGFNHMDVGRSVTGSWGLPTSISVPIGFHHCPERLAGHSGDLELLTRMLHLSSLFIDMFKHSDPAAGYAAIEECLRAQGLVGVMRPFDLAGQISAQAETLFPMFELQIDLKQHLEIIEAARAELAKLSGDLVVQVHQQARRLDELTHEVGLDPMTRLDNHQRFQEILKQEISRAKRYNTPLSILMADVDRFKAINDFFGHPTGDQVLKRLSAQLRELLRDSDHIARYGGEEFAAILPSTSMQEALRTAERLRRSIESQPIVHEGRTIAVTMSFGVAALENRREIDVQGLVKMADEALYEAKNSGRNRCCAYRDLPPAQAATRHVLVIDDEAIVRVTVSKMLERLGYCVHAVESGSQALEFLKAARERIDLVIMDLVLPDVSADRLLGEIRSLQSSAKVLLSSGYSLMDERRQGLRMLSDGFLQKPYQMADLAQTVRATLNPHAADSGGRRRPGVEGEAVVCVRTPATPPDRNPAAVPAG
jgi:diguanylate cyclase (GGDEF)-like protein